MQSTSAEQEPLRPCSSRTRRRSSPRCRRPCCLRWGRSAVARSCSSRARPRSAPATYDVASGGRRSRSPARLHFWRRPTQSPAPHQSRPQPAVALTLSLNGQQWVGASSVFTYQQGAEVQSVIPDLSPNVGGLVLELTGANLAGGMDYRCGFGHPGRSQQWTKARGARRTHSRGCNRLRPALMLRHVRSCAQPRRHSRPHVQRQRRLNGQQYSGALANAGASETSNGGAFITFYDPDGEDLPHYGGSESVVAQVRMKPESGNKLCK